ncbi:MAG: winged helix-turn-helix transcriptional regulator [Oscillospiraceae bacterium]|nr:winged helix-turn-helix transcriptional regulator [Oscillospiraceae bacterium]
MVSRFEQFCSSVACIYRNIQKIERIEMAKYGLKGPHAQVLLAMSRHPDGVTSGELVKLCDKDKAAISRTVAELEREGMVTRAGKNGNLYRAVLTLTDRGRDAAGHVAERAKCAVEAAGNGLTDEQRKTFYAALDLIASHLQTIGEEGLSDSSF